MVKLTFKEQMDAFVEKGERLEDPFFSELEPISVSAFIPGHIYTFSSKIIDDSLIPTPDDLLDPKVAAGFKIKKPYYDTKPIGICLAESTDSVSILNIKVMPLGAAQVILNIIWQNFNQIINKSYRKDKTFINSAEELYSIPEYAQLYRFNSDPFVLADLLGRVSGNKFNIRHAVNKYQKADIINPKLVPFHLVPRVALVKVFDGIQTRALSMDSIISPFIKS